MSFNAADPSGAGGLPCDVATLAAMGAHALPVTTSVLLRDSAEIFDHHPIDPDVIVEQARTVLEDITVTGWKVGFLPAAEVLVGNHKTLTDFLLPDWDSERPASARELAVAAGEKGTPFIVVTGIMLPAKGTTEQYIDNVLASPQGAISGEKFEMFDASFVGAGDTFSAALAALLAAGSELQAAVGEALQFMDQSLDSGFRPGLGGVEAGEPVSEADPSEPPEPPAKGAQRRVH
ncbi:MAG: bifunctional hydroxymethylpyrimidine kinase/phosphomethylpyrimidine kinase [Burkholderiales bacterium]|nr:bifunctional hydroxymethylpyrimidine kinase/phosphomethylpyrimidine kinase [Burkholderiales bacterium]